MSTEQKKRLLSGIFSEYNRMHVSDIVTVNADSSILVMVLPRLDNQLAYELTLTNRSRGGHYDMVQSINILCEQCISKGSRLQSQLHLPEEQISIPFLLNFSRTIRLIGTFIGIRVEN